MVNPVAGLPARIRMALAAARSMPKMHWRWRRRGRDIVALLQSRFGSALPDDDYGLDAAKLLAQHYMRLTLDAERVTRANLRLWAPWGTEKTIAHLIRGARKSKTPSAAQLGKDFRVTVGEVASLGLSTITAFSVTLEGDRVRQARRRRNAGATKKRGRPKSEVPKAWQIAGASSKSTHYRRKVGTGTETENSHAVAYIRGMKRDGISVSRGSATSAKPWQILGMSRRTYYRYKAADTLPRPIQMPTAIFRANAIDLDTINLAKFGIVAIRVMRGTEIVRAWNTPCSLDAARGAPKAPS